MAYNRPLSGDGGGGANHICWTQRREIIEAYPLLAELLGQVEAGLQGAWEGDAEFLRRAAQEVLSGPGKRLRPSLLLLSAECSGGANERSVAVASVVEIVHTASLIHDDVVDESQSRRGRRSARALWGSKLSVLLGDYLIARAFRLLPEQDHRELSTRLAEVARRMCDGQIRELRNAWRHVTEAEYLEIVAAKTGSLFGFCGGAGALTAGASLEAAAALARFGERFGVAFQLADDILDFVGTNGRSGKPAGRDFLEGKLTLPLILMAERGGVEVREHLTRVMEARAVCLDELETVREMARATGAVEDAWGRFEEWLADTREQLALLPDTPARQALLDLAGEHFPLPVMASA